MGYENGVNNDTAVTTDLAAWASQYKEQSIEMHHSNAMFDLVSPDDSILIAGPAKLSGVADTLGLSGGGFYVIGVCQSIQIQDSTQIQPLKSVGSRRHLFTKTNVPASASIGRMMFYGKNMARALYMNIDQPSVEINDKYYQGDTYGTSNFLSNLEEDLYRIPFGLGIIYHTPRTASQSADQGGVAAGAEYLECCYLQSRAVSVQSGQTTVMEQVQILADRVVPWDSYKQRTEVASPVAANGRW